MFHSLTGRGSSVRIQIEQPLQQVQAICPEHLIELHQFLNAFDSIAIYSSLGHHFEVPLHRNHLHEVDSLPLGHRSSLALRLSVLQDLNRLWVIRASQWKYFEQLFHLRVPIKQDLVWSDFSKDATHRPHIDLLSILSSAHKEFRSSVPQSAGFATRPIAFLRIFRREVSFRPVNKSGHREIWDCNVARSVKEYVFRFEVTVHHTLGMTRFQSFDDFES